MTTEDEKLERAIDRELDEMFIAIGGDDFRLHSYWVKDMREVRDRLIAVFKRTTP